MPPKPVAKKAAATGSSKPNTKTTPSKNAKPAAKKTPTKAPEKKTEAKKEPEKVPEAPPACMNINIKEMAKVLFEEENNKIRESGKWPLLVDPSGVSGTFLKYRHVNYIEAFNPSHMVPETMRKSLLGAMKYAKALVIDMNDIEVDNMFKIVTDKFNEIQPGLMEKIMDRSILTVDNYNSMLKEGDPVEFEIETHKSYVMEETMKQFMFIVITKGPEPPIELKKKMFVVTIG